MLTFHRIYEQYFQDVYRYSYWLSGSAADADDITSETFIRAWVGRKKIRTETVKAYLFAIARNLYLNQKRTVNRTVDIDLEYVDPNPGPDSVVTSRMELRRVMDAIQSLPEADRAAFLLRVQHELPYEEIARVLELTVSAAKVKVHRARLKLAALQIKDKEKFL